MSKRAVSRKDINLLTVLEALYIDKSVSRTAIRLNLTQSAVSHALRRLRDNFGDELFVRTGQGVEPTSFTQEIMPEVHDVLGAARKIFLHKNNFDPMLENRLFKIGMPEYVGFSLLESLHDLLRKSAPNVRLLTINLLRAEWKEALESRRTDLIVGRFHTPTKEYAHEDLFEDDFICVASPCNALIRHGSISLNRYLTAPHLAISAAGHLEQNRIDRTLNEMGHKRQYNLTVPNLGLAFHLLKGSKLLLTAQRRVAEPMAKTLGLATARLPFPSPVYQTRQIWHRRYTNDSAHIWLRAMIRQAAKT